MSTQRTPKQALNYSISILGGVPTVARLFGFATTWAVYKWVKAGQVPTDRVLDLVGHVRNHGGQVSCHELRPDRFPPEVSEAA